MFQLRYIWMLAILIICTYCGKDVQSLGRQGWGCKEKVNTSGQNKTINVIQQSDSKSTVDSQLLQCSCRKESKVVQGLKIHQRHCRIIEDILSKK